MVRIVTAFCVLIFTCNFLLAQIIDKVDSLSIYHSSGKKPGQTKEEVTKWYESGLVKYRHKTDMQEEHFYENGQLEKKLFINKSNKGISNYFKIEINYYQNGQISDSLAETEGFSFYKKWYPDGILQLESKFKNLPSKYGYSNSYSESGMLKSIEIWKNGIIYSHIENGNKTFPYFESHPYDKVHFEKLLLEDSLLCDKAKNLKFDHFVKIPSGKISSEYLSCPELKIERFYIQQTEVSNVQYRFFYKTLLNDSLQCLGEEYINTFSLDSNLSVKIFTGKDTISYREYITNHLYDHYPVVGINYYKTNAYCWWLQENLRHQLYEKLVKSKVKITEFNSLPVLIARLPTESEWEYAATEGKGWRLYTSGLKTLPAFTNLNGTDKYVFTSPVRSFSKNSFGLYNMIGNVSELCVDGYNNDYSCNLIWKDKINNPYRKYASYNNLSLVVRGSNYTDQPKDILKTGKRTQSIDDINLFTGFRPVFQIIDPKSTYGFSSLPSCDWNEY